MCRIAPGKEHVFRVLCRHPPPGRWVILGVVELVSSVKRPGTGGVVKLLCPAGALKPRRQWPVPIPVRTPSGCWSEGGPGYRVLGRGAGRMPAAGRMRGAAGYIPRGARRTPGPTARHGAAVTLLRHGAAVTPGWHHGAAQGGGLGLIPRPRVMRAHTM